MNMTLNEQTGRGLRPLLPLLADGAALLALLVWLPALSQRLQSPSGWNALLLVLLYVLFCLGVYLIRKLLPVPGTRWSPPAWLVDRRLRAASGFVFALLMATTLAYQLGFFESIFAVSAGLLEEGSTSALFVYAPGAWLGFSAFVVLVLAFPVNSTIAPEDSRFSWVALIALLCTDAMLIFSAAQARAMLLGLGLPDSIWFTAAVLVAFLASYLPARALYLKRQPYLSGWLSFAVLLLAAVQQVAYH